MKWCVGFTIALVVTVLVVAATLPGRTVGHNDASAIATLNTIHAAQLEFQERRLADADRDGRGEYGLFGEMSGVEFVRDTKRRADPPVLSTAFRAVDGNGVVLRWGFCLRVLLPGADGGPVSGPSTSTAAIDTDAAEEHWCCYAWPIRPGNTGFRSYYVDETGVILATEQVRDTPPDAPPSKDGRRWVALP